MGLDPLFERRKAQGIPTFREATAKVLAAHRKTWKNEKHEAQWQQSLRDYAFPHIGNVRVNEITGPMIRNLLSEIWLSKPETARRVRQRVGAVLNRSEEHTSELQSLMRISYAVFCLKTKTSTHNLPIQSILT